MYYLDKTNNTEFTKTKQRGTKFLKLRKMYLQRDFRDVREYWSSGPSVEIFMAPKLIIIYLTGDPTDFGKIKLKGENIL